MSEVGAAVRSLVFENGKSSSEMTHDFKVLGDGKMQDGLTIKEIVEVLNVMIGAQHFFVF